MLNEQWLQSGENCDALSKKVHRKFVFSPVYRYDGIRVAWKEFSLGMGCGGGDTEEGI